MTQSLQYATPLDRDYARLTLGVPATLQTLDARLRVEIVDISQGGAHCVLPSKDDFAQECLLSWLRFEAFGAVSWRKGADIGIAFEEPLSHRTIFETRRKVAEILQQDSARTEAEARTWAQGAMRV